MELNDLEKQKLCLSLARSDSEEEVIQLLKDRNIWDNPTFWRNFGDNENNFSTIGNQQSRPEAALVEKIINSVDALLMLECLKRGDDPTSTECPQSIIEALEEYFDIKEGKLTNLTPSRRSLLAENIYLVASGSKTSPCYAIVDKGEGQTPNKMPDTLLSLGKSNKLRIPFVQGKFNMGGTGVFQFCGKHNIQLFISKRNPDIGSNEKDNSKNKWGFTIIRREDPKQGVRSSTYRYLAPQNSILSFESESLPLLPGDYPIPCEKPLYWGTYIKLFNYQMTGLKTNILFDLNYRLALLMPQLALPIKLCERRRGYSGHTFETTLAGLTVRLEDDRSKNLETGFPTSSSLSVQGQKMKASIFAFKRDQESNYKKDEGIIFTINGQTHGRISKDFFRRGTVKMGYLANSILVIIDCSEFDGRTREDLFMNSRDRLRSGDIRSEIENVLEDMIRHHEGLRELANRRMKEEVENKLMDDKPLADIIEKIIKKSPTLSSLFIQGTRIPNPWVDQPVIQKSNFIGKQYPTYFTLINQYPESSPKSCHINLRFRIQFRTDARNDYFDRDIDPGDYTLLLNSIESKNNAFHIWNGIATLSVALPESTSIGDNLKFETYISDSSRSDPFYHEFFVHVIDPANSSSRGSGGRKGGTQDDSGKSGKNITKFDIPKPVEVRKDDWNLHKFDGESALKVVENEDGSYNFFINVDNKYLRAEEKYQKNDAKLLKARYSYGMVLIGLSILHEINSTKKTNTTENDENRDVTKYICSITKALSPVILPMISELSALEVEEEST